MKQVIINKIKGLKPLKGFAVQTKTEQQEVLRTAQALRATGIISFRVVTSKEDKGGWKVVAI